MAEAGEGLGGLLTAAQAGNLDAQLRMGADCFRRAKFNEAAEWFRLAAGQGSAEAQNSLATLRLNGMGVAQDTHAAFSFFESAALAGLREAHYNLSILYFNGIGVRRDTPRAGEHLLVAARAGHRAALRSLGFLYHAAGEDGDWPRLSSHCFRVAAEAGDAYSKYLWGLRLLRGHGQPADRAAAQEWFAAAARDGVALAALRAAGAKPHSASDVRSTRNEQPFELRTFSIPDLPAPHASRSVAFMSEHLDVLDDYLCDHLMNVAASKLAPSGVVDPHTGAALQSEKRTSYSMHFQPSMYDTAVYLSLRCIANVAGQPMEHAEPLGILRYGPGQEYKPHYDYYSDDRHEAQRVSTVFVYLNDVAEGGGTDFPRLQARVEPARGKAVKFLNCGPDGKPNPDTLHAGLPVIRGEKWLATLWFWDRPFLWFA